MTKTPIILHIESSGELCSVALSRGSIILESIQSKEKYSHSTALATDVRALLEKHLVEPDDLHAVSVSGGPGSYTGLRVGVSFAKAMCFALEIPLIATDTLESLAVAARKDLQLDAFYYANIDARRMEVYIAAFDSTGNRISGNSSIIITEDTFDRLINAGEKIVFCGTGTTKTGGILTHSAIVHYPMQCRAEHLVAPALISYRKRNFADLGAYRPDYVKAPNITVSTKPAI